MKNQKCLYVNALAVNVIIIWLLDSDKSKNLKFLDVFALAVNVIIILIFYLDCEEPKVFVRKRTSCNNLDNCPEILN